MNTLYSNVIIEDGDVAVGKIARLLHENLDGSWQIKMPTGKDCALPAAKLHSPRVSQVRLPVEISDRILFSDVDMMKSMNLFYLITSGPKPALLEQLALMLVLKTLAPTYVQPNKLETRSA